MARITKHKFTYAASMSAAAVLLVCGVAACGKFSSTDSLLADAKQYHQKGDDTSAQIQLKNVLQKSPDNVEARYLLGVISNEVGDPLAAEKELRKAVSLGMPAAKVAPDLGQSLLMQNQFQKALDETAIVATQGEVPALRGNAFLGLGKLDDARQSFQTALKANPDAASALIGLAKIALVEKNVDAANALAEQAASKNPQNVAALLFRANLLRGPGAVEPALAAFDKVLALKPDNVDAHLNKADLEIRSRKYDAAKLDIDAARKVAPKNLIVQYMQAVLDFSQGKNADALIDIQKVVQAAPDYMPGVLIAGAVQYALGALPQAEQYLTKYLIKNPEDVYARKLLTSTYLKSGQVAKATDTLKPALDAMPQDVDLLGLAGEAAMQNKDFTKATAYFEKASTLAPQTARFHTALGLSNLGMGQNAAAVSQLQTASNLDASSPQAGVLLVMTHIRLKEFDQAMVAVNVLEKEQPTNPLIQDLKGGVYLGKNDLPNARASFEKALTIQPDYFPAIANLAALDLKQKQPDAAKKRFEAVLVKDKKNIDALNALANLALSQKHPEEATTWLERSANENPDSLPVANRLASHYMQIGEKQKALTLARKLQASNPRDPQTLELLGQIQSASGDKESALQSYQRLAVLVPDSAPIQLKIAAIQIELKDIPDATEAVRRAIAIQPDYLDAQVLQASLFAQAGNQIQAVGIARQIQKQPGQAALGYELEGNFQAFQKKPDLAVKAYQQAFTLDPNPRLLVKILGVLTQAGNAKEADDRIKQWFQTHPNDVTIHMYLAEQALAQKQNKVAIDQYQAVLKQQPENAGALNNLAWAYQQEQDPRALATAEQAYKLAPTSPPVLDTLGWMLVQQGTTARGVTLLQQAATAAPGAMDIRYHLVQALLKSGDKTKARTELQQLLAANKPFPQMDEAKALLKTMGS